MAGAVVRHQQVEPLALGRIGVNRPSWRTRVTLVEAGARTRNQRLRVLRRGTGQAVPGSGEP